MIERSVGRGPQLHSVCYNYDVGGFVDGKPDFFTGRPFKVPPGATEVEVLNVVGCTLKRRHSDDDPLLYRFKCELGKRLVDWEERADGLFPIIEERGEGHFLTNELTPEADRAWKLRAPEPTAWDDSNVEAYAASGCSVGVRLAHDHFQWFSAVAEARQRGHPFSDLTADMLQNVWMNLARELFKASDFLWAGATRTPALLWDHAPSTPPPMVPVHDHDDTCTCLGCRTQCYAYKPRLSHA